MGNYCTVGDVVRAAGLSLSNLPKPMTEDDIKNNIGDAEAEIDGLTNTTYKPTQATEILDGSGDSEMWLDNYPIITLDSLMINGTSVTPSNVAVYTGVEGAGRIRLKSSAEKTIFDNTSEQLVSVTYTYGFSVVPPIVKRATANIAARMTLASQLGGKYEDLNSFNVGEFSGTVKDSITDTIKQLKEEFDSNIRPHLRILPDTA